MKNKKNVLICVIILLITFVLGFLIGISIDNNEKVKYKKVNVIGTYRTNTWNGKEAVIVFKNNMSCMYPNNSNKCEWSLSADIIRIVISKEVNEDCNIKVYLNDYYENRKTLIPKLEKLEEVDYIGIQDSESMLLIEPKECNLIDKLYNEIGMYDGINHIDKHAGGIQIEHTEHIATLIDGGLMLEGHFFEKLK